MTRYQYFPMLRIDNEVVAQEEPLPEPVILTANEDDLLWELRHHPQQQRTRMIPHADLMQVARARAADMAEKCYVNHVDAEGHGPNWHVRQTGYRLPDHYQTNDDANNIESIAAGQKTVVEVIAGWSQSPGHWTHVMAYAAAAEDNIHGFYAEQTECGIGYAMNMGAERWGYWWVLITAPKQMPR